MILPNFVEILKSLVQTAVLVVQMPDLVGNCPIWTVISAGPNLTHFWPLLRVGIPVTTLDAQWGLIPTLSVLLHSYQIFHLDFSEHMHIAILYWCRKRDTNVHSGLHQILLTEIIIMVMIFDFYNSIINPNVIWSEIHWLSCGYQLSQVPNSFLFFFYMILPLSSIQ